MQAGGAVGARPRAVRAPPHLWCRGGEWRFVHNVRHSDAAMVRHVLETMSGVPDSGGWRRPASDPSASMLGVWSCVFFVCFYSLVYVYELFLCV